MMLNKLAMGVVGLALSWLAKAAEWHLQSAASRLAGDSHGVHEWLVALVSIIFVGVFGFMFWSIYAHRKSVGHKAENFHENVGVELAWAVIPMIILVIVAWPVAKTVLAQYGTSNADVAVKVAGMQWKSGYDYLKGEGESISVIWTPSTPRDQIEGHAPKGEHYPHRSYGRTN